ncbi:MAG: hypothetical protein EA422_03950 [Gemmatimonadales bacterium]|nr:MAG: hypothetical protein EA422_03950 [Gemmatimonadales bacterium]
MVGVIPAGGPDFRLGKAKALLDAGDGTFLERAVAELRAVGADPVLVGVDESRGPLHAAVRAVGARPLHVAPDRGESLLSLALDVIRDMTPEPRAQEVHRSGGGDEPEAEGAPGPVPALLWLPVDLPLVQPETLRALVAGLREAGSASPPPALLRPSHQGKAGEPVILHPEWVQVLLGEDGTGADGTEPATNLEIPSDGPAPWAAWDRPLGEWGQAAPSVREIEVEDPGIHIRIRTLTDYRRRFPRVFRRRFQKW